MAALSEWLQIMLAEIARKRDDLEQARAEEVRRATEEQRSPNGAAHSSNASGQANVLGARVARR